MEKEIVYQEVKIGYKIVVLSGGRKYYSKVFKKYEKARKAVNELIKVTDVDCYLIQIWIKR